MSDNNTEYTMGLGAAAFLAGISYQRMLRLVQERTIAGEMRDGRYFTSAAAVRAFIKKSTPNTESPTAPVAA